MIYKNNIKYYQLKNPQNQIYESYFMCIFFHPNPLIFLARDFQISNQLRACAVSSTHTSLALSFPNRQAAYNKGKHLSRDADECIFKSNSMDLFE